MQLTAARWSPILRLKFHKLRRRGQWSNKTTETDSISARLEIKKLPVPYSGVTIDSGNGISNSTRKTVAIHYRNPSKRFLVKLLEIDVTAELRTKRG